MESIKSQRKTNFNSHFGQTWHRLYLIYGNSEKLSNLYFYCILMSSIKLNLVSCVVIVLYSCEILFFNLRTVPKWGSFDVLSSDVLFQIYRRWMYLKWCTFFRVYLLSVVWSKENLPKNIISDTSPLTNIVSFKHTASWNRSPNCTVTIIFCCNTYKHTHTVALKISYRKLQYF